MRLKRHGTGKEKKKRVTIQHLSCLLVKQGPINTHLTIALKIISHEMIDRGHNTQVLYLYHQPEHKPDITHPAIGHKGPFLASILPSIITNV